MIKVKPSRINWWKIGLYAIALLLAATPLLAFSLHPKEGFGFAIGVTAPELLVSASCVIVANWRWLMIRLFRDNYLLLGTRVSIAAVAAAAIFIVWCFANPGAVWGDWAPLGFAFLSAWLVAVSGIFTAIVFGVLYRRRMKEKSKASSLMS
jgi:membrane associated rhomboid family serine protease